MLDLANFASLDQSTEEDKHAADEDLIDDVERMMLLLENDVEEDFVLVLWEVFLKYMVTGRHKDYHSNLDLKQIPIDCLYMKALTIFGRNMISEGKVKANHKLLEFDKVCEMMTKTPGLREAFVEEMINLT